MPSIHYFLGQRLLASTDLPRMWDDTREARNSEAFLCPTCGELWGRIFIPGGKWMAQHVGCARHPGSDYEVGATFIHAWRYTLEDLPYDVLAYELAIRLAKYKTHGQ